MAAVIFRASAGYSRELAGIRFEDGVGTAVTPAQIAFCERRGFERVTPSEVEDTTTEDAPEAEAEGASEAERVAEAERLAEAERAAEAEHARVEAERLAEEAAAKEPAAKEEPAASKNPTKK